MDNKCALDGCGNPIYIGNAIGVKSYIGMSTVYFCLEHFSEYLHANLDQKEDKEVEEELVVETITLEQFAQSLAGQEIKGTPAGIAYPVEKTDKQPGQELLKQRVRVTFEFDVTVNAEPILSTNNDNDVKDRDIALLTQFLQTDKALDLMVDTIGCELGLNCPETFITAFLSQIDTDCHSLFSKAIAELLGKHGEYWRNIAECRDPQDLLSICTEEIIDCFSAQFVSSKYEVSNFDTRE